jgi:hypothetical protein
VRQDNRRSRIWLPAFAGMTKLSMLGEKEPC